MFFFFFKSFCIDEWRRRNVNKAIKNENLLSWMKQTGFRSSIIFFCSCFCFWFSMFFYLCFVYLLLTWLIDAVLLVVHKHRPQLNYVFYDLLRLYLSAIPWPWPWPSHSTPSRQKDMFLESLCNVLECDAYGSRQSAVRGDLGEHRKQRRQE